MSALQDVGPAVAEGRKTTWQGVVDIDPSPDDQYTVRGDRVVVPNDDRGGKIGKGMLYPETAVEVFNDEGGAIKLERASRFPATHMRGMEPQVELPPPTVKKGKKARPAKPVKDADESRTVVSVEGPWGRMSTECSAVVSEGVSLVLVGCSWVPPATDDVLRVSFDGRSVEAYSPGISFELPLEGRVVVLLVEE